MSLSGALILLLCLVCGGIQSTLAAQPAAANQPDLPGMPAAPTEAELRERVKFWMKKLNYAAHGQETDLVRKNLIALGKPAVPLIIDAAQSEFRNQALPFHLWNVCLVLGGMADDRAVPYLLKRFEAVPERDLKQRPDWNYVRAFSALALGRIPDQAMTAAGPMRATLSDEKEPHYVRRTAALGLGALLDEKSIGAMDKMLMDAHSPAIMRGGMALALGMIRGEAASQKLVAYLEQDIKAREPFTDRMAVHALGMQRYEKAVPVLRKLLGEEDGHLKGSVALVLGWIGNRDAAADVQKVMDHEKEPPFTRCNAAVALNGLGQPEKGAEFLRHALQLDEKTVEVGTLAYVAVALGEFSGDENLKELCATIDTTKYPVVALNALNALGHRKDTRSVPFLIGKYMHYEGASNQYLRGEVVRALLAHAPQESIRALLHKGLKDQSNYVQGKCAVALARYPGTDTERALFEALKDKAYEVRGEAALTLGVLKCAVAVEALRGMLKDESDWVRLRARRALENIVKFGKNEFQQSAGMRELIEKRVKAVGASLSEEMDRLHAEGYQRILELDRPGK